MDRDGIRVSAAERVYLQLRRLIVRGRLPPGSRIVEGDVAARLRVSRTPVRESLVRLRQDGFVVPIEGGRYTRLEVAPLVRADVEELWHIVESLEGFAAQSLSLMPRAPREGLAWELERINSALRSVSVRDRSSPNGASRGFISLRLRPGLPSTRLTLSDLCGEILGGMIEDRDRVLAENLHEGTLRVARELDPLCQSVPHS